MADEQGRKLIEVNIPGETFSLKEFEYDTLDAAIERLTRIRDNYPDKVLTLSVQQEAYSDYEFYQVREKRRETDAEMAERVAREEAYANQQRERDLQALARLRKEYPDA